MHSFGGDIQCDSAQGEWTEFTLSFPLENSNQIRNIKKELFSSKSILLVSEQTDLNAAMHVMANQLGFQLKQLSIDASLGLHEHISQYDIVLLDVDNALTKPNTLEPFESLWGFSEATIVYLFKDRPVQRHHKAAYLPLWIERDSCLFDTYNILDNLVFDTDGMRSAVNFTTAEKVGTRKVLLVDDNESLRKFTAILLQKEGIDVLQTENGQQALSVLAREEVDLILMDIEMPIMDGIETTKRIRQSNQAFAGVPIIAHTGDNSRDMLDKISSSFMSGYLVKPASKKQLLDVISDWI
jgi:two-component system CAI-1 autoinducer sensor kinase/phosphatase CqsS